MNTRIVERTMPGGNVVFVIQQQHFLFRWWWVDAWVNSLNGPDCTDTFLSLDEAERALPFFDKTLVSDRVVT